MAVQVERIRQLNEAAQGNGPVVYWMQRDQRADENWALLYAQEKALERKVPLVVVFNLTPSFGDASFRHYDFMLKGLKEVESDLGDRNIPFILLSGNPADTVPEFSAGIHAGEVVTDFNPLQFTVQWREKVAKKLGVRLTQVDARNVVPCWVASPKEEFAAYTFRPKIHKQLRNFLHTFPLLQEHPHSGKLKQPAVDWDALLKDIETNQDTQPVDWLTSGTRAAKLRLAEFIAVDLDTYAEDRNDPNKNAVSHMSPYLHFGQISAQWVALQVQAATDYSRESRDVFLEELIVRRELTDNFCFYNKNYDQVAGAHAWAQKTIAEHAGDEREYLYERKELEEGKTHDELWNAMQMQMVTEGKMHGWCRMYWAKKILEWSPNTQTAIDRALYLNDKYELDGSDPNGIVGVMWSICGVHDRAWTERPIFGKIRYMNFNGAKRKFNIQAYIDTYTPKETLFDD